MVLVESHTEAGRQELANKYNMLFANQLLEFGETLSYFPNYAEKCLTIITRYYEDYEGAEIQFVKFYSDLFDDRKTEVPGGILIKTIVGIKEFRGERLELGSYNPYRTQETQRFNIDFKLAGDILTAYDRVAKKENPSIDDQVVVKALELMEFGQEDVDFLRRFHFRQEKAQDMTQEAKVLAEEARRLKQDALEIVGDTRGEVVKRYGKSQ